MKVIITWKTILKPRETSLPILKGETEEQNAVKYKQDTRIIANTAGKAKSSPWLLDLISL